MNLRNPEHLVLTAGLLLAAAILGAGCTTAPGGNATATVTPAQVTATPAATATVNLSGLTVRDELAARAATFAARLGGDNLTLAKNRGPGSPEFSTVQRELQAMKAEDPRVAYVYTIEQMNGTPRFMVDADFGGPNGSSPGDLFENAPAEFGSPVSAPGSTGVYTDRWGTFVTGYAPVRNSTGASVGLLLVDMPMSALKTMITDEATSLAARVNAGNLSVAVENGTDSAEYQSLARDLKEMMARDGRLTYINIFQQGNGTTRFVVDSEYGNPGSPRLGDVGIELPAQIPSAVNAPGATDVYTNRWGTGFTGYAPIRDGNGAAIAVFRIDMGM